MLSIIVALTIGVAVYWCFDANSLSYMNTREAECVAILARSMESAYTQRGDWDFLRDGRMAWFGLLHHEDARARANGMGGDHFDLPPGRRFDPLPLGIERGVSPLPGSPTADRLPPHPPGESLTPHSPI